jgi:hypothetical protein
VIATATERDLEVAVRESFGNCPQYIHIRDLEVVSPTPPATEVMNALDQPSREAIQAADTFFVATSGGTVGVDISHRGGRPGFVRLDGDTLTIPDFSGNRYFNTLGNMLLDGRAALLFADFASGDLLHVQGRTEIVWQVPAMERLLGAERLWRVSVMHAWRRRGALPFRWSLQANPPALLGPEVGMSSPRHSRQSASPNVPHRKSASDGCLRRYWMRTTRSRHSRASGPRGRGTDQTIDPSLGPAAIANRLCIARSSV